MSCGIYKIVNTINDKIYVGSSIELDVRLNNHKYMLNSNSHYNTYLQNSVNKYGMDNFNFVIIEECDEKDLISRENHYISLYQSNDLTFGYNLATVNEFRRNNYNDEVKVKNSKLGLQNNGNYIKFKGINLKTNDEIVFDNLVEAANYLINNGFTKAKNNVIRQRISECLRQVKIYTGSNWTTRKKVSNHKWEILE